ncbi:hypothetical protein K2X05_06590 [bacterium]|nr:hypothetical protein [bacterium]
MVIKSTLLKCKKFNFILFAVLFLSACQNKPTLAPENPNIVMPQKGPETNSPIQDQSVKVPDFVGQRAPRVGLIFGPGGVKTLAQIGVLQEFEKNKIPVVAVAGLEWGALIGSLYAMNGQSHEVDWKISQLPKLSPSSKSFFSQKMNSVESKDLDKYLQKVFADSRLDQSKLPMGCPFVRDTLGKVSMASKGTAKNSISSCWKYPPLFALREQSSAPFALLESAQFLRANGAELVVLINVLEGTDKKQFAEWGEADWIWLAWLPVLNSLKNAQSFGINEVVSVDTSAYKMYDLDQRLRLIQLGKQSAAGKINLLMQKYDF